MLQICLPDRRTTYLALTLQMADNLNGKSFLLFYGSLKFERQPDSREICEITITRKYILTGSKLSICDQNTNDRDNKHPRQVDLVWFTVWQQSAPPVHWLACCFIHLMCWNKILTVILHSITDQLYLKFLQQMVWGFQFLFVRFYLWFTSSLLLEDSCV